MEGKNRTWLTSPKCSPGQPRRSGRGSIEYTQICDTRHGLWCCYGRALYIVGTEAHVGFAEEASNLGRSFVLFQQQANNAVTIELHFCRRALGKAASS